MVHLVGFYYKNIVHKMFRRNLKTGSKVEMRNSDTNRHHRDIIRLSYIIFKKESRQGGTS